MSVWNEPTRKVMFEERGFLGPFTLFSRDQCRAVLSLLEAAPTPIAWTKGNAASSRAYFAIGSLPEIVDVLAEVLGPDVMLWGADLVHRDPGQIHPWHTDIETSDPEPGCVSVWIGLRNVDIGSSLELIARSHRFGVRLQDQAQSVGSSREQTTSENVAEWSRRLDPASELIRLDMRDGDVVLFDGRLWHGSNNTNPAGTRSALLLQYAVPSRTMQIPDFTKLDPPFRYEKERPPCVMVRGQGDEERNRIVPPPPLSTSWVHRLRLPLEGEEWSGWTVHPVAAGPTSCVEHLSCHASMLAPGKTPHEPHRHLEEEVLIVLEGEAELEIVDEKGGRRLEAVAAGTLVYYPAGQRHTIHNRSGRPVTYCMFKWRNGKPAGGDRPAGALRTAVFRPESRDPDDAPAGTGWRTIGVFEGPTDHLRWLHCHRSAVAPSGGYPEHVDPYDVAIVVLGGEIETLGERCGPHDIVFYAAGEPHGLRNPGAESASYLVLEFHAVPRSSLISQMLGLVPPALIERLPEPVIRYARRLLDRLRL